MTSVGVEPTQVVLADVEPTPQAARANVRLHLHFFELHMRWPVKSQRRPIPLSTDVEGRLLTLHLRDGCRATPAACPGQFLSVSLYDIARKQGCNELCGVARTFLAAVAQLAAGRSLNLKVGSSIISCRTLLAGLAVAQLAGRGSRDLKGGG